MRICDGIVMLIIACWHIVDRVSSQTTQWSMDPQSSHKKKKFWLYKSSKKLRDDDEYINAFGVFE